MLTVPSGWPLPGRRFLGGGHWDCSRKVVTLVIISALVGACTLPQTESAAGQPQAFDLICTAYWVFENASSWQRANLPDQHYHIDLINGLVNYTVPLSANPLQLAWTPDYGGYTYRIAVNRLTGALYEIELFPSGLRTGHDISGTCELLPPPPPQPKF